MSVPAALLFDVDGTLADTERDGHRVAFNQAFQDAGLDWHWSDARYGELLAVSGGKERIRCYMDRYHSGFRPPMPLDAFIAALHQSKNRHYAALLETGRIPLRPGVRRLLAEARAAGIPLLIVTTTSPENVLSLLEYCVEPGSAGWFEVIAAGDVVPAKKPAPDIYHYALAQGGLAAAECLALEDSENGLRAARAAGVPTVVTVSHYTQEQDFSGALLVVDHLGEPEQPFHIRSGAVHGATWVDLDLLRRLHPGSRAAGG
ncbi:MAG: phosphatase [Chromatiales bacterium 21-64-14]|nr:MAG: phosphatase [Chromatiales bacterium 21-64-14]HQU15332.1 HAD family hydrolase [Gammaproteobacteria bacterium]